MTPAAHRSYKGNLHLHTTCSDGKLSPAEAVAWYRQRGYDFIALTDHNTVTPVDSLTGDGFLVMHGVELGVDRTELGQRYHLVALGLAATPTYAIEQDALLPVQPVIASLNQNGAAVFLAHPNWSGLTVNETMPLAGLIGVEVYNTSAGRDLGKALGAVHWDDVLARGKQWWGLATDDTHWMDDDAGEGWVMVQADDLGEEAILAALKAGRFYASTGPEIHDLRLDGDIVTIQCSPVSTISFIGQSRFGGQRRAAAGDTLTGATYHLKGRERYLRVECIDTQGRTAWSNPFYL